MEGFEEILKSLSARGVFLDHLGQLKNGKLWSATVRKKGTTSTGYGTGKNIKLAVKGALTNMRDTFDPKLKPKKKRVRV
jgi:hypothetical protein